MLSSKPISKIMALILSIAVIAGMTPVSAFAEEDGGNPSGESGVASPARVIAAFDELAEEILYQGYDFGEIESENDLTLPDTLTGTDEEDNPITIEGVKWKSSPVFDGMASLSPLDYPDGYVFTAVLPKGYTLADGVAAPVISVVIRPEGGVGAVPLTAAALKTTIDNYGLGGGSGTPLTATVSGNTVTVVGNVTGARQALSLNIGEGVTVVWRASLAFSNGYPYSYARGLLSLMGDGTFELAAGRISGYRPIYAFAYLISAHGLGMLKITGGEVHNFQDSIAIALTSSTLDMSGGTIKNEGPDGIAMIDGINNVTIRGGNVQGAIASVANDSMITISGGTIRHAWGGPVVELSSYSAKRNVVFFSGGTVESVNLNGINAIKTNTSSIVIVWDKAVSSGPFRLGATTGLTVLPAAAASAKWDIVSGVSGISYKNSSSGGVEGFIQVPDVFVMTVGIDPVDSITVTGAGGADSITTNGGTLQMQANVLPASATKAVTWTVHGTGATISASGLLTATANGTVTVRATATDGTGVYGEKTITIGSSSGDCSCDCSCSGCSCGS